jgi:hypothetical protein
MTSRGVGSTQHKTNGRDRTGFAHFSVAVFPPLAWYAHLLSHPSPLEQYDGFFIGAWQSLFGHISCEIQSSLVLDLKMLHVRMKSHSQTVMVSLEH